MTHRGGANRESENPAFCAGQQADLGTKERWQHAARNLEPSDEAGFCFARVLDGHVLDQLVVMGALLAEERDAAFRFQADYQAAGLMSKMGGSYAPVRNPFSYYGGWDERSDAQEEAYTRWRGAMRFLRGDLADIVVSVVCYEEFPDAYRLRGLRAGLKVLKNIYGK